MMRLNMHCAITIDVYKRQGYHIHVAEGIYDLHQCLKEHGKRIVDRLHDWNILGPKTLLGHCIYVNEHEMDLIKDTDTMVVHNPESVSYTHLDVYKRQMSYRRTGQLSTLVLNRL